MWFKTSVTRTREISNLEGLLPKSDMYVQESLLEDTQTCRIHAVLPDSGLFLLHHPALTYWALRLASRKAGLRSRVATTGVEPRVKLAVSERNPGLAEPPPSESPAGTT